MKLTAFPWFGGKSSPKIHKALIALMPPHTHYVEPFGGGASILLDKEPARVEVYNDVNRGLVNFFRVVADADYFARFLARVSMLPVSRVLYEEHARTWAGIGEPVEQAVRWYYVARQSFRRGLRQLLGEHCRHVYRRDGADRRRVEVGAGGAA